MKSQLLLAALAILYQVSQSKSKVNEQLESLDIPQNIEKTSYKKAHDKHEEISIKREGGLKKLVPFSNKSNEATNTKYNPKKQKLHELRRLRKSRSNETSDSSNNDVIKIKKFSSEFDLDNTAKSRSNENLEETNPKIRNQSKEEFKETNSSHENMFHAEPMSLSGDYAEHNKAIDSSSGDKNLTTSYKDHRKQKQFRHLWGQDRSIHSYRSASMHKKPFWYSPYHFPRAKVTVAGLNIPWFRLRSTFPGQNNIHKEPVQLSKPDSILKIQKNNTSNVLITLAPIDIRVVNISNIGELSVTHVNRINSLSQVPTTPQLRLPYWPNFYKNMDHTSEKPLEVYKSVRVPTKSESVETEKTETELATYVSQKTTQVYFNENDKHANYIQYENDITGNTSRISNPGGKDVEVSTVDNDRSTNIELQNVTPRGSTTTLGLIREPQWPPWPRWLNEPLQKNKNVFNNSYVLNEYTADVYANNEKNIISSSVKLNDATEKTKKIDDTEESELFFDIANTYNAANIAELLPLSIGITVVATTEANDYINTDDAKGHYSENISTLLPNLRNIVRCTQGCPLTPEFNPVCGTDDITYTNPGRLLCLQFCGLDVKVKKYQPCSSKHKLSEYPTMVNLFINTAIETLRATVKANTSTPSATEKTSVSTPKATVKANYFSTPSPTNSTTVFYVRYDSFSVNDDDEDSTEANTVLDRPATTTETTSLTKQIVDTTEVTSKYIEKSKELKTINSAYIKRNDSKSPTIKGPSQVKHVPLSSKKIESNHAALNNMLKHSGRDVTTKAVHAVTYSTRDVATNGFIVTRAIEDASTKKNKINFRTNTSKSSISKNNLILKQGTPRVDTLDSVDDPHNNGRRFVESPFVALPYSSGEYVSPDENAIDNFQDIQKESDDAGDDTDSKFWRDQTEKEKHDIKEQPQSKEKTHSD